MIYYVQFEFSSIEQQEGEERGGRARERYMDGQRDRLLEIDKYINTRKIMMNTLLVRYAI